MGGRGGAGRSAAGADPGGAPSPQAGEAEAEAEAAAPLPLPPEAAAELQAAARELTREAMEAEGIQVGGRRGPGGLERGPPLPPPTSRRRRGTPRGARRLTATTGRRPAVQRTLAQVGELEQRRLEVEAALRAAEEREEQGAAAAATEAKARAAAQRHAGERIDEAVQEYEAASADLIAAAKERQAVLALLNDPSGDDRRESAKAGAAGALAGGLSHAPLAAATGHPLGLGVAVASCALFGVTYRYVVREDWDNFQLKSGAVGAFGLVRAAALAEMVQAYDSAAGAPLLGSVGEAALLAGQSMLMFAVSAVALEAAVARQWIAPFRASFKDNP